MPDYGHELKFGVFITPTAAAHEQVVRTAVTADVLGLDSVSIQDHPYQPAFLDTWTLLTHLAAHTERVHLFPNVANLPLRHPAVLARSAATLDILSEGRVSWGSGKSASLVEQKAFENDIATLHAQWAEALEIIPRMWAEDVFSHRGRFFDIPPIQVLPKPVQDPHPPMFGACTKPDSAADVGRLGLGARLLLELFAQDLRIGAAPGHDRLRLGARTRHHLRRFALQPLQLLLGALRVVERFGNRRLAPLERLHQRAPGEPREQRHQHEEGQDRPDEETRIRLGKGVHMVRMISSAKTSARMATPSSRRRSSSRTRSPSPPPTPDRW